MSIQTVFCNACGQRFAVSDKVIKMRLTEGVLFRYFQCPHCEAVFLISAADEKFRKFLAKRGRLSKAKKAALTDREEVRRMSDEQKRIYAPLFSRLFPKAWQGDS